MSAQNSQMTKILSKAIDVSTNWAKRSKIEFGNDRSKALFGIVQVDYTKI